MDEITTDVLILGSGGAGLFAALRCADAGLDVTLAVKGLFGKSGCTRMVQGGCNAVLDPSDSIDLHLRDTIVGGAFLNDQRMAMALVKDAPERILELEERAGCRFDRRPDGSIHQKAFGGQSFDRTVHRGDLTGIEIVSRLAEQVMARPGVRVLSEVRALDLIPSDEGDTIAGSLLLDLRSGAYVLVKARSVLVATGGGARMYRYSSPSTEKSGDGVAMAFRLGLDLMDMEMLQFHPTGLLAGDAILTGSVVEEGLRGAGGLLLNGIGERFMTKYDPERLERSTRDRVSRAIIREVMSGMGTPQGGVYLDMRNLGSARVRREFPGMTERARAAGRDLGTEPIEVLPTAHFHMGGVRIDPDGRTTVGGLYVAGEDAAGVHGANRLGGNGVAESLVFGARAGDAIVGDLPALLHVQPSASSIESSRKAADAVRSTRGSENPFVLRQELEAAMWDGAGVIRDAAGLEQTLAILDDIESRSSRLDMTKSHGSYDLAWQTALNLVNLVSVARALCVSALARTESRGAHFRSDFPEPNDAQWLRNVVVRRVRDGFQTEFRPVEFVHLTPGKPA